MQAVQAVQCRFICSHTHPPYFQLAGLFWFRSWLALAGFRWPTGSGSGSAYEYLG
eukprot:COSAG04_NODE_22494_length_354_cov_0.600000_1_plen_54_part_10